MTSVDALYRHRFQDEELPRKKAIWKVLCAEFFQKCVKPSDTVLDLACGYGEFITNIRAAAKHAADLNPDSPRFLDPDIRFHRTGATDLSEIPDESLDVVFTSNFLEHLPDKAALSKVFDEVRRVLRPGGRFLILGPNIRYLPGAYWDFLDHHLPLTHNSVCEALALHEFSTERVIPRFLPYTTKSKLPTGPAFVSLYLKIPLVWPILGKQFFIVARKPPGLGSTTGR